MKTTKQWIDESNWSEELKKLFWGRVEEPWVQGEYLSLDGAVSDAFSWSDTPEGLQFWHEVARGKRTDIDRLEHGTPVSWENTYGREADQEYETLIRKLLQGLKGKEVGSTDLIGLDYFARGYNAGIREMNEKIDEALKKLEL